MTENGHSAIRIPLIAWIICASAWAQNTAVSGRVIDTSGAVIQNAAVELTNRATMLKSVTRTNTDGIFIYPSVPPGDYTASASLAGFTTSRIDAITLEVAQSKTINFTLSPGDVKQSINVTDQAAMVTTDRADRGTVVENQFVNSLPLLTRNPLLLVTITAGTVGTATPGSGLTAGDGHTARAVGRKQAGEEYFHSSEPKPEIEGDFAHCGGIGRDAVVTRAQDRAPTGDGHVIQDVRGLYLQVHAAVFAETDDTS
jgi:hypothetical protein